ncbi:MAG: glycosyltransferase family 39 protein [Chloroflexota bacterium]|nr:glycosyltransferase family 39 protein [Chloroflexota bacterium]
MKRFKSIREIAPWRWQLPAAVRTSPLFWIPLGSLLSFALTWRLFFLPMVSDEGGYAYAADRWLSGRGELYHDVWISRPQAIFLLYGAVMRVVGDSVVDLRLVAWACNVATMIVVWSLARRWQGPGVAAGATLVFAVMMGSPATEGFTANAEIFMALPAAISILTLLRAYERGWSVSWLVLTGILVGISTQLKPSGIVMIGVAALFVALMARESVQFSRVVSARIGAVLGGFGISLLPAIYHGIRVGWDAWLYASVTYRLTRQSTPTSSLEHHLSALGVLSLRIWPLYIAIALVFLARFLASPEGRSELPAPVQQPRLVPAGALGIVNPSYAAALTADPVRLLMQLWILGCLAGISMGGDWWYHYLIQIAAPFAIWMAVSVADLRVRLSQFWHAVLIVLIAATLLTPYGVLTMDTRAETTMELFGHPGYADQEAVAQYIRENTPPETPIFVAFDQAALYYLADRPSSYRYLYDQELRAFPDAQDQLIHMLESDERPYYIVGTRQLSPFEDRGLAFWETVQRYYVLETVVRGVPIYRAIDPPAGP